MPLRRRLPWLVFSILLAGVLLYASLRGIEWRSVWRIVANAHWLGLAAGASLTSLSFFFRAVRWRILLNAESRLGMGTVFCANMAGYVGNNFLPARAGELLRSYLISIHSRLSKTYVLTTALSERLMDVIALVLASSVVLLNVEPKPHWMDGLSRSMAIASALGAVSVIVLPHTGRMLERVLQKAPLPAGLRGRLVHLADQVLLGLRAFHDWKRLAGFAAMTALIWCTDAFTFMTWAAALELHMSFSTSLLLLTGLGLGSALPSTPGYVGITQFVAVNVLPPFGISRNQALAYILVVQACGYVVSTALGLPGLYQLQRARPTAIAER